MRLALKTVLGLALFVTLLAAGVRAVANFSAVMQMPAVAVPAKAALQPFNGVVIGIGGSESNQWCFQTSCWHKSSTKIWVTAADGSRQLLSISTNDMGRPAIEAMQQKQISALTGSDGEVFELTVGQVPAFSYEESAARRAAHGQRQIELQQKMENQAQQAKSIVSAVAAGGALVAFGCLIGLQRKPEAVARS